MKRKYLQKINDQEMNEQVCIVKLFGVDYNNNNQQQHYQVIKQKITSETLLAVVILTLVQRNMKSKVKEKKRNERKDKQKLSFMLKL